MEGNADIWRQVLPALIISLIGVPVGIGLSFTAVTSHQMLMDSVLTLHEFYLFASLFMVGTALGALVVSVLLERLGRKVTFMFGCCGIVIGFAMVAGARSALVLHIGRTLTGISMGIVFVTGVIYISEFTTGRLRGVLTMTVNIMLTGGILVDLTAGVYLHWRYLALLGAAVGAVSSVATLSIPESPRWLLLQGRRTEAETALHWFRGPYHDIQPEFQEMCESFSLVPQPNFSFGLLRQSRYWRPALLGLLIILMQQACGSSIIFAYLDDILSRAGWGQLLAPPTIALGVFQFMAAILNLYAIANFGRRRLLLVNLAVLGASFIVLAIVFQARDTLGDGTSRWLCLAAILSYVFAFNVGVGGVCPLVRTEILPTQIRGAVTSATTVVTWGLAGALTQGYPYVAQAAGDPATFGVLAALTLTCVGAVLFTLPETKDLTLENIEQMFAMGRSRTRPESKEGLLENGPTQSVKMPTYGSR